MANKIDVNALSETERKEQIKKTNLRAAVSLAPVILAYIVFVLIRTSGGTVGKDLVDELGWAPAQLAMFTSVFSYVYSFANLPAGMLVDSVGGKKLIASAYVIMAVGLLLQSLTSNYGLLILSRGLMGFGGSVVFVALSRLIANWTKSSAYADVNAKVMAASKVGTFYAATPLAAMIASMGRKNALLSIAVVVVLITVAIFIFTREDPASVGLLTVDELEGREKPQVRKAQNPFKGIGKILMQPMVWLVLIGSISMNGAINTFITNFGRTMLAKGAGFEGVVPTNIITVNTVAGIISGLLLGQIMKIKGTNNKNMTLFSFALFITAEVMAAFFFKKLGVTGWSIAYALIGFGSSIEVTTIYAILKDQVTKKNFGTVVGVCNFFAWLLGTSICTSIWGKIIDVNYSAESFMNASRFQLAVSVVGCICILLAKDKLLPAFEEDA
jgi:sugar phosphate permease